MSRPRSTKHTSRSTSSVERATYSVDELARHAGVTVRNIRAYQDRRILPPPERNGRSGVYTELHLARLAFIKELLGRGYTIANISELIRAWEDGRDLNQVLGVEAAMVQPTFVEPALYLDATPAAKILKPGTERFARALEMGLIVPEGSRYLVTSRRLFEAGLALTEAGVPIDDALALLADTRQDVDAIANRLVETVDRHLLGGRDARRLPGPTELRPLADTVMRLRSLADLVVRAELARALEAAVRAHLGERLDHILAALADVRTRDRPGKRPARSR